MLISRRTLLLPLAFASLLLGACDSLQRTQPLQVTLVGVEPLEGQGLELRMLVKLRIQNPNEIALDFDGVSLQLDVQDKPFASGVSDAAGRVARFGESVIAVPVSISAFNLVLQAMGALTGESTGKLAYEMRGKLAGPVFNSVTFKSKGELTLPSKMLESSSK